MNTMEANIKISRRPDGKLASVAVLIPVWNKISDHGNLFVSIPLLGIETVAKDEKDAEVAIRDSIHAFCLVAEKCGQGLEQELMSLGWVHIDGETGEPVLGYDAGNPDDVLDRIFKTADNYANDHLEIA